MTPSGTLLSPLTVGRTTLKNRIIKAPQTLMYWGPGGQIEGLQGAIFLRKRGRNVTVLEESAQTGVGVPPRYLAPMRPWLARNDFEILTEVAFERITPEGIRFARDGAEEERTADTIMVLMPPRPNRGLVKSLNGAVADIHTIGSANGAGAKLTVGALRQGREAGVAL